MTSNGIKETHRHKEYYIDGGDFYLIAEHTHFRVHTYFFLRESEFFHELLKSPTLGDSDRPGCTHSSALQIDATADDFATFLKVFYNPKYTYFEDMTTQHWMTILNLAHKWRFREVKSLAIRELEKIDLDVVPRMALYQKNHVDDRYILPLYVQLCMRDRTPTDEESNLLGLKTITLVFRARERLRALNVNAGDDEDDLKSPLPSELGFESVLGILTRMLKIEPDSDDLPDMSKANVSNGQGSGSSKSTQQNTNSMKANGAGGKGGLNNQKQGTGKQSGK